jgi:hypothetical protein
MACGKSMACTWQAANVTHNGARNNHGRHSKGKKNREFSEHVGKRRVLYVEPVEWRILRLLFRLPPALYFILQLCPCLWRNKPLSLGAEFRICQC